MTTDDERRPEEATPPEASVPADTPLEPEPLPDATPEVVEPPHGLFSRMMRREDAQPEAPPDTQTDTQPDTQTDTQTAAVEPEPLDAPSADAPAEVVEVIEAPRGRFSRMIRQGPRAEALAPPSDESAEGIPLRPARIVEPPAAETPPATPPGPRVETRESIVRGPRPVLPPLPTEQAPEVEGVTAAEAAALEAPVVPLPAETTAALAQATPAEGGEVGEPGETPAEVSETTDAARPAEVPLPVEAEPHVPVAPSLRRPVPLSAHMVVITGLATAVTLAFVLIEPSPRWWLLLGVAAVIFGMDGVLRAAWRHPFEAGQETAPFLFLPALYILAVPVLIEHNARGEWALMMALLGGLGFGVLTWGEVASVRVSAVEYPRARLVTTSVAYFTAFAFFSLTYVFQVGLFPAMVAVGLASTMLSVELLREGEIDPLETLGFALVAGLVVAEGRWLIHYLPLDRYMAGLALLVVFYFTTGVIHSYITRQFTPRLAFEYGSISAAALALVVLARAGGLA